MLLLAPHLLPVQARQAIAQPPKADAVTTAPASALARVWESEFMEILRLESKVSSLLGCRATALCATFGFARPTFGFHFFGLVGFVGGTFRVGSSATLGFTCTTFGFTGPTLDHFGFGAALGGGTAGGESAAGEGSGSYHSRGDGFGDLG